MAMVVRSNMMAYNANRQLGMNNSAVSKNLEKLSSGFKINRAADDAAGLAVSEKMKAQIKGLEQASLNSQDGISLVQTAEGALTEVHDMLNRMTELATKSANGTIQDQVDREAIQNEVKKLNEEIDRIAESTNFNGIKLLDGSMSGGGSTGASGKGYTDVSSSFAGTLAGAGSTPGTKAATNVTFTGPTGAGKAIEAEIKLMIGDQIKNIKVSATSTGTKIGEDLASAVQKALGDSFTVTGSSDGIKIEAKESGKLDLKVISASSSLDGASASAGTVGSHTAGTDDTLTIALNTAAGDKNFLTIDGKKFQILKQGEKATGGAIALYTDDGKGNGTGQSEAIAAQLKKYGIDADGTTTAGSLILKQASATSGSSGGSGGLTLQIGDTGESFNQVTVSVDNMSSSGIGTSGLNVANQVAAKGAIETIKSAINKVSTNRSELGALQNRLEHTINNLDVAAENMTNANSRIRDTDMAKQMMEYTKMNVLTQSAQAMLAQANQNPQSILQLLQ